MRRSIWISFVCCSFILSCSDVSIGINNLDDIFNKPNSSLGNFTILCAKEYVTNNGRSPVCEWYLLGEPITNKLYYSQSLKDKVYITTFKGDIQEFSFGVLPSGDIIACKRAEYLRDGGDDANRVNPYVFKLKENWYYQHEVNFGNRLKPCGWARNGGFRALPNGTALMCEYTRITVSTSNVWKIVGDPLKPDNWEVKKSFTLSGDRDLGFKHCHAVMFDHFSGTLYLSTGDIGTAAMVFASTDSGETWNLIREPNQRFCRLSMMTFTEEYIYWGGDNPGKHEFFRGERVNGVLDFNTVIPYVVIPGDKDNNYFATYGQAYLPEYDAVLLFDRQDSGAPGQVLPIRIVNLSKGTLDTLGFVENTDPNGGFVGFRTIYSEWYPVDGKVHLGFGFDFPTYNKNKVCGNKWPIKKGKESINNLIISVGKKDGKWSLSFDTLSF